MDPTIYFTFFVGGLLVCAIGALMHRTPTRPCPACGIDTATQARRCQHCKYRFG